MVTECGESPQSIPPMAPMVTTPTLQEADQDRPRSPTSSDNSSTHSSAEESETSTIKYEQESYGLFKPRVAKLCKILFPPPRSTKQSWLNRKAATLMRGNKFLRFFVSSKEGVIIEHLRGGDYNRILGITLPSSYSAIAHNHNLILRVPRWGQGQIQRVVATLEYLCHESSVPVANVVAKDVNNDNPLGSPYVIQHRIPGSDLELLWPEISHSQRCTVARVLGKVIKQLLALESPIAGHIEAFPGGTGTEKQSNVVPFDLKSADGDWFEETEQQVLVLKGTPREGQTTLDFFRSQIGRWRAVDVVRNAPMVDRTVALWDSMLRVVEEMNEMGLFPTNLYCLCHVDLQPRNIMAEIQPIQPDGSIQVTGILDWDEAIIAPKFVNCEPPGWLWGFNPDDVPRTDLPTWPYEVSGANDVPSTLEEQELKRIFEDFAGSEYLSLAYDEQFRLSRGLFRIAVFGLTSSENYSAADRIITDWAQLRGSLRV